MQSRTLIRLQNVHKSFQVGKLTATALKGVELDVYASETLALMGPSGSGKSTLLNVLGLIEVPTIGDVEYKGRMVSTLPDPILTSIRRRSVGFIFQNFNLLPILSAQENVEYPLMIEGIMTRSQMRKAALEMLDAVGLSKFAHHRPAELSGGQRQRVAIARALVKKPELILTDEPTANLDSVTARQVLKIISEIKIAYGTTTVIATHDPAVAAMAERVVHIRDGLIERIELNSGNDNTELAKSTYLQAG